MSVVEPRDELERPVLLVVIIGYWLMIAVSFLVAARSRQAYGHQVRDDLRRLRPARPALRPEDPRSASGSAASGHVGGVPAKPVLADVTDER